MTYQKGFRTARQGALQETGSYWSSGVSVFSFKGVYRAPMGTTSLEASYAAVRESFTSEMTAVAGQGGIPCAKRETCSNSV